MYSQYVYVLLGVNLSNQTPDKPYHYIAVYSNRSEAERVRDELIEYDKKTGGNWNYSISGELLR